VEYLVVTPNRAAGWSDELTDNAEPGQTPTDRIPRMHRLDDPDRITFGLGPVRPQSPEMDESVLGKAAHNARQVPRIVKSLASGSSSRGGHLRLSVTLGLGNQNALLLSHKPTVDGAVVMRPVPVRMGLMTMWSPNLAVITSQDGQPL
jgi:hypothetical protein